MKIEKIYTDEITRRFFAKAVKLEASNAKPTPPVLVIEQYVAGNQDREMLAMRDFYANSEKPCTRVHVRENDEVFTPLEGTRMFGPFSIDVLHWVVKVNCAVPGYVTMGHDASGREYLQY